MRARERRRHFVRHRQVGNATSAASFSTARSIQRSGARVRGACTQADPTTESEVPAYHPVMRQAQTNTTDSNMQGYQQRPIQLRRNRFQV
jgi:hypothetical protein